MFRKIFNFIKKAALWFFAVSIFLVIVFRFVPVPFTPLMGFRFIENTFDDKTVYFDHDWVPLDRISPNLQKAVIASEDATFIDHYGFDLNAIEKAMKANKKGKKLRGGSTISQQTAKNVFLWQGRSWIRKGLEAYFTVLIEIFWTKERIMEVYLNSIEMGNGVYGAQAASRHWYSKDANQLTKREAAGIAAILPNPRKYEASYSSAYINKRKSRIVSGMRRVKLEY
ncbi:monofunctional biosynthetic peptidoglycan transglycosylase [Flavobacterium selenitireducens]|uniref:monofunctional biosynthetic peptidoglycan transglycosylase n=1 Tax=Flavobacterium selenitireducens TaxID=2722704 RepID=UPI00168B1580|nr:monofunctional biosynthetic peptidoglycan transglycosylase [Flavobacterium selenitireducens]MBD3582233.1 monofunctional biosynthetic peptidoglycan transglycosylase [Flavobacterium selenitireducens]